MYVPAFTYFLLFRGQAFPEAPKETTMSTAENLKAIMSSPIYWLMLVCMALTATTELGTQSWVERILANSGAQPLLVLALVTVLMAVGRMFAGPLIHRLNITGVLLGSAIISALAIFMMSMATGPMVYVAAVLFAIGVCYFWPNMISFVADYLPKTGALGMSLIGGVGMLGLSIFQPIIGGWIEGHRAVKSAEGLTGEALELAAGQATLANIGDHSHPADRCVLIPFSLCEKEQNTRLEHHIHSKKRGSEIAFRSPFLFSLVHKRLFLVFDVFAPKSQHESKEDQQSKASRYHPDTPPIMASFQDIKIGDLTSYPKAHKHPYSVSRQGDHTLSRALELVTRFGIRIDLT